jgi:uncharacterized membrane protein
MNENDKPLEDAPFPEDSQEEQPATQPEPVESAADTVEETVEAASAAAATAADEAQAALEDVPDTGSSPEAEAPTARETQAAGSPAAEPAPTRTITERLAEDTEYDTSATNDDRLLAAISYASQLLMILALPVNLLIPIILLVSETSKKRSFVRYHAVQSLALGIVIYVLEFALGILSSVAAATFIGLLCLCIIIPAMIVLWLLPLYYAIVAYNGKRFAIPGLTQFLKDQRWL